MEPLTLLEAEDKVSLEIRKLGEMYNSGLEFRRASPIPIEFPDGWRFPFDTFFKQFRVRQLMVILFVPRDPSAPIILERDDWASEPQVLAQFANLKSKRLPALKSDLIALTKLNEIPRLEQIEALAPVWEIKPKVELGWRASALLNDRYQVIFLPNAAHSAPIISAKGKYVGALNNLEMGLATLSNRDGQAQLLVDLRGVSQREQGQWTVWCGMALVSETLEKLGYRIPMRRLFQVRAEFRGGRDLAETTSNDPIPVIQFRDADQFCWARDPSIVVHELGHAIWYLHYTSLPNGISRSDGLDELVAGVEEGFCDYFAAALLARETIFSAEQPFLFGKFGIDQDPEQAHDGGIADDQGNSLRVINGEPFELDELEGATRYQVAPLWSNFLWALHRALGGDVALPLILQAHLKPPQQANPRPHPLLRYAQAIQDQFPPARGVASEKSNAALAQQLTAQHLKGIVEN